LDSDVVETVTIETEAWLKFRDRDFIRNPETGDLKIETETRGFKIYAICRNFKKCRHRFRVEFFQISGVFPTCFGCFLPANSTNKNRRNIEILLYHFFAVFKVSRPVTFETGNRDSQKWVSRRVSRPRPTFETPSGP